MGRNGQIEKCEEIFGRIDRERRDAKTFSLMLSACAKCGDVRRAKQIWNAEIGDEQMRFDSVVLNAYIDCCARNGAVREMLTFVRENGERVDGIGWMTLLSAAKMYADNELVRHIYAEMRRRNMSTE